VQCRVVAYGYQVSDKFAASVFRVSEWFFYPEDGASRFLRNVHAELPGVASKKRVMFKYGKFSSIGLTSKFRAVFLIWLLFQNIKFVVKLLSISTQNSTRTTEMFPLVISSGCFGLANSSSPCTETGAKQKHNVFYSPFSRISDILLGISCMHCVVYTPGRCLVAHAPI
jgi:hypothetical protein